MPRGRVTRRDPQKGIPDTQIPTAGSLPASAITSGTLDPARVANGLPAGGTVGQILQKDSSTDYDTSWVAAGGGGSGLAARGDVSKTTASLAHLAVENSTMALGKSFIPLKVVADRACRVRLYQTAAYRTADASREPGTDPTGEHGVILDLVFIGSNLTLDIIDPPTGFCGEASVTENIPYAIENQSGSSSTVQIIVTRLLLESA